MSAKGLGRHKGKIVGEREGGRGGGERENEKQAQDESRVVHMQPKAGIDLITKLTTLFMPSVNCVVLRRRKRERQGEKDRERDLHASCVLSSHVSENVTCTVSLLLESRAIFGPTPTGSVRKSKKNRCGFKQHADNQNGRGGRRSVILLVK